MAVTWPSIKCTVTELALIGYSAWLAAGRRKPALSLALVCLVAAQLAGCYGATGDFGRPEPGPITDKFLPATGKAQAQARGEPVSDYNLTDNEKLLRNRAVHLQNPPHARDWYGRSVTRMEAARVLPGFGRAHAPDRYYAFLRSDKFRSSESRYERLKLDMYEDTELVLPFCEIARIVRLDDRQRLSATRRRPDLTAVEAANARGRVYENNLVINQVEYALEYRLAAYRYAIDRIEIETPSDQIWDTNRAWRRLSGAIVACESEPDRVRYGEAPVQHRSRIYTGPFDGEERVPQK